MTDLTAWVRERLDNCQRIAVTKEGSDRDGWLEDAAYFAAILDALEEKTGRLEAVAMLDDSDKHDAGSPEDRAFHAGRAAGLRMAIDFSK